MKTKQEIKEEIIELYGATQALGDAMNILHAQRMEKSKQMMALNQMLKDMDDDAKEKRTWVGLSDEEILAVNMSTVTKLIDEPIVCDTDHNIIQLGKAIEAKLKDKNT